MKIDFTPAEREIVEESWGEYIRTINLFARLHGLKGPQMAQARVADDRSGLVLPDPESPKDNTGK